jgi:LysM repeat protein
METLSHTEARRRLQAAADGHLASAHQPALDAHLSACSECRAYAAELTAVEHGLRRIFAQRWGGAHQPRLDLVRRLAYPGGKTMRRNFWPSLAGALAVLVLVAAIAFTLQVQIGQPASGSGPDGDGTPAATETAETPPPFTTVVLEPTVLPDASAPTETPSPEAGTDVQETISPTPPLNADSPPLAYVVSDGDTCQSIADRYAVSTADMLAANNLDDCDGLRVGDEVIIPYFATDSAPPVCPVTAPPAPPFVPPAPYDGIAPMQPATFWYGTADLWTRLREGGVWHGLPYHGDGFAQKLFWWRDGYHWQAEPNPAITVSSTRLDVPGDTYVSNWASNGYATDTLSFMNAGPVLPTPGCWRITGNYGGHSLSFVVWVAPAR